MYGTNDGSTLSAQQPYSEHSVTSKGMLSGCANWRKKNFMAKMEHLNCSYLEINILWNEFLWIFSKRIFKERNYIHSNERFHQSHSCIPESSRNWPQLCSKYTFYTIWRGPCLLYYHEITLLNGHLFSLIYLLISYFHGFIYWSLISMDLFIGHLFSWIYSLVTYFHGFIHWSLVSMDLWVSHAMIFCHSKLLMLTIFAEVDKTFC